MAINSLCHRMRRLLQNTPSLSRVCTLNETLISSSSSPSLLSHNQSPTTIQSNPFSTMTSQYSQNFQSPTRFLGNIRSFSSSGTINHNPQNSKFGKHFRGRMKGIAHQGNTISFGRYALQVLEPAWITSRQIEAGRRTIARHARQGGKIWVRVYPDKSVSGKALGTRMGRGKGAVQYWVAVVKPGRILYEIGGVAENVAKKAIATAASKMSVRTRFTSLSSPFRAQFSTMSSNSFSTIASQNFQSPTQRLGNLRAFCSSSGPSNLVLIKSPEEFKKSLSKAQDESLPAVFYFTAAWCGPCRIIAPKTIEWSKEYPHVTTYKIDIDEEGMEDTLRKMEITAVPTFIFFHKGEKVSQVVGASYDSLIDTMRRLYKQD